MFRMIRRAPWIALGATAAYYFDGPNGPARRCEAADRARALADRAREQMRTGGSGATVSVDEPLTPSVSQSRVRSRASGPQSEETAAGVPGAARPDMAAQILEESEWRVTDRAGTSDEHRRSEDTVAPTPEGISGVG